MRPPILSRERLARILLVLDKNAGTLPIREITRTFSVRKWEIEAAAALGWVEIITRKPPIGRPSRLVLKVNNSQTAKLPPYRSEIEKPISIRHERFALFSTHAVPYGSRFLARHGLGLPCITDAYQRAFPSATNRRAAAASASRLKRRYDVRIARAWFYARFDGDISRDEPMPTTPRAIWQRLKQARSWRV
ncbi:hypothetical protein GCM10023213_00080 [Prosthecobacter algae]|uniref:Uncharacterized protein n=1 Tax=Prosthecobacter algae TaxID=1144682 RepID=A0ABP9NW87_9BACT